MASPPPKFTIPPKKEKKKQQTNAWDLFLTKHPAMKRWASAIREAARKHGIDALFLLALVNAESGGNPDASSKGAQAHGLTQISTDNIRAAGKSIAWVKAHPEWALDWSARKVRRAYNKYKNYKDVYLKDYNPADPNRGKAWENIASAQTRNYTFGAHAQPGGPETPEEAAARGEVYKGARDVAAAPRIAKEDFKRYWNDLNDLYQSYAGRNASHKEAKNLYKSGLSPTSIIKGLIKRPSFYRSPTWQSKSRDYFGIARDMGMRVDKKLVANAIANNWDGSAFAERLRELPGYLDSGEFKTKEAGLSNIYRSIYGEPTEDAKITAKEMALGRWSEDQAASYFRSLPQYRNSAEYQSNVLKLQEMLGMPMTAPPVAPPAAMSPDFEPAPDSPRVIGSPNPAGLPQQPPAKQQQQVKPKSKPKPKKPKPRPNRAKGY